MDFIIDNTPCCFLIDNKKFNAGMLSFPISNEMLHVQYIPLNWDSMFIELISRGVYFKHTNDLSTCLDINALISVHAGCSLKKKVQEFILTFKMF